MKFLLFGTGDYYERYKKWFGREDTLALLDNSLAKQGTWIDGLRVLSPEEGVKQPYEAIVILSFYVKEMRRQLAGLGVPDRKVFHFYDLHKLIYRKEIKKPIQYFGDARKLAESSVQTGKKILLLSQDMTLGGPAIALFHAAQVLKGRGYDVVYASMLDGALREKLLSCGIPAIVDVNLQLETMKEAEWTGKFSLLICNTINFHVFLSDRDTSIPVIWWLHESEFFYDGVDREVLQAIDTTNLKICSVGRVPESAIRKFVPDVSVERLLYGVEDAISLAGKQQYKLSAASKLIERMQGSSLDTKELLDRVWFVTIGYIEWRKGQDILVRAIQRLPDEVRKKAVFCLIGQDSSEMAQKLKAETMHMPEVVVTGTVDRDGIHRLLEAADAMVCPSREDPMPTVAAEAMMHGVPCIISDAAGTAEYIRDGVDGFVFGHEALQELSRKLWWCIEHYEELPAIGIRSRWIYEKNFSMEVFQKGLLETVGSMLASR